MAWAGGAVSRACQAGWLAMLPRGGGHGVRVQLEIRDVSGYSGQRIFCIFVLSHAENIEDQSKCRKTLWWDDGLNPVISTHGFPIRISGAWLVQADPVCTLVWCVWLPACLVGPACYRTGSRVGLLRAGSQRRYKNCQMCHYHILGTISGWRMKC